MSKQQRSNPIFSTLTWLLTAAIACAAPAAVRAANDEPADFKKLERQLHKVYTDANYEKALELAEKMHELRPRHVETIYNLACLHCLLGDKAKAYTWLEKAIDAGYKDAEHVAGDDDFTTIRGEDRFRALVKRLRSGEGRGTPKKITKPDRKAKPKKAVKPDKPKKPDRPNKPDKPARQGLSRAERFAKVNQLTQRVIAAAGDKKYDKALKLALEARDLADVGLTNYNVACMYALLKNKDKAFKYLDRSIELGGFTPDMIAQIKGDSDFDNIRNDPRYAKALKKAGEAGGGPDPSEGRTVDFKWKVTLPKHHNAAKKAPLLVALHPYNGSMDAAARRWRRAADKIGAILLTPQGTVRLSDGHYQWGRDRNTIETNVMDAINEVLDKHKVDEERIILTGFSQGGWATWTLAIRNPDAFRGIIPVAGRFDAPPESYFEDEDLAELRIYIMVGEDDNDRVVEGNRRAAKRFKRLGAKVRLNVYEDVGHAFPDSALEEQLKALTFILEG